MSTKRFAYRIKGTDRRQEYIEAFDANTEFITQIISGSSVEFFTPTIGFGLLAETKDMSFNNKRARRIRSIAELTLETPRALREVYYALRNKTRLLQPFTTTVNLYEAVLRSIIDTEIACDVERERFAVGNRPAGSIFYGHHVGSEYIPAMSNPERIVGFTENIARALSPSEVEHAMSIIHVEKNTMAGRLHTMKFSKLTNSIITTAGGNYTRAVFALAGRFISEMPMLHCCDADAYGNDMLRTTQFGSMNSRHITLDQAFPPSRYPNMHFTGFYPSIGERLGLPNDLDSKRPMNNPHVKKRIEFLKRYDLVDDRDVETWERNKTYEMEALSESAINSDGEPIGVGIYITEYMRHKELYCKPQPTGDAELLEEFKSLAKVLFKNMIETAISANSPRDKIFNAAWQALQPLMKKLRDKLYKEYIEKLENALDDSLEDVIRDKLLLQYEDDPYREHYSLYSVVEELFDTFDVTADWKSDELMEKVKEALDEFSKDMELETEDEEIEFAAVDTEEREVRNFYDVVEEELGADPDDCLKIREALEWRLG